MGAVGSIPVVSGLATGKQNEYKQHETSEPLSRIATHISYHPSQKRAAFISAAFADSIELYVSEGVTDDSDVPSEVYQITTGTKAGVYGPEWEQGSRLTFQRNLSRLSLKIPPSYTILEHKIEKRSVVNMEATMAAARGEE